MKTRELPKIKLKAAIDYAGNQSKLAVLLGVRRQCVSNWKVIHGYEYLPELWACKLVCLRPDARKIAD